MLMVKHNGQSEEWRMRKRALMQSHLWLWGFQWEAGLELDGTQLGRRYCQPEEHASATLQLNKRQAVGAAVSQEKGLLNVVSNENRRGDQVGWTTQAPCAVE